MARAVDGLILWRCPNCGQTHFGEAPPDMCDFCGDFTTWRRIGAATQVTVEAVLRLEPPVRYIQLPLPWVWPDED